MIIIIFETNTQDLQGVIVTYAQILWFCKNILLGRSIDLLCSVFLDCLNI